MANQLSKRHYRGTHRVALVVCLLALPASVAAQPVPCSRVVDPTHRTALAEAEVWLAVRWAKNGAAWLTQFTLKPEPRSPFGTAITGRGVGTGGETRPPSAPIAALAISGQASVSALSCTTYEVGPDLSYVVRYSGRGLRFNENATGWTRPLRTSMIHVLEVRPSAAPSGVPMVIELGEVRTALPPDMQLTAPTSATAAQPLPASKRR